MTKNELLLDIRAYAVVGREHTASEFDQAHAAQLDQSLSDLQKVLSLKYILILKGCDLGTGARFQAFALTKTALDVLVSALQMTRQRAGIEAVALLRVALEAACTSHHIVRDENAYKQYLAGRYGSTRAITHMKADIPCIGEIWGAFSSAGVHTLFRTFGPRNRVDGDGTVAAEVRLDNFGARPSTPQEDALLLTAVSLVAMILLRILECNCTEDGPDELGGRQILGTGHRYFHDTDKRIAHYYESLVAAGNNGASHGRRAQERSR